MNFVIASSKDWHRKAFDKLTCGEADTWAYVKNPEELRSLLIGFCPQYIFYIHWNWKVPSEIWEAYECVCFHMTDLPYGRGGSPLQNLILSGKSETVVTALRMVKEMDAGPVYAKEKMSLAGRAEDIYLRAGSICWEMIESIIKNNPTPIQQEAVPTYFKRRRPEDSRLPELGTLIDCYNFIRMLDAPTYPLACIYHGQYYLEFSHADICGDVIEARVIIKKCDRDT